MYVPQDTQGERRRVNPISHQALPGAGQLKFETIERYQEKFLIKTTMKMAMAILGAVAMGHASADVKIGFLATLSGPSAENGIDQLDGFNLAVEQLGGLLGGKR